MNINSNSQIKQDLFVLNMCKFKKNGYFVEIGANDAYEDSNTYLLEKGYEWKGIMIENDDKYVQSYKNERPNSIYVIDDATKIDYIQLFNKYDVPKNIDYLQIDLEPANRSSIDVLEYFDKHIFDKYKFATITFEHDIYKLKLNKYKDKNYLFIYTRNKSREILEKHGYIRIFSDVSAKCRNGFKWPFEDWYVHPDLVDINYINDIINKNKDKYININNIEDDKMIYYDAIVY